MKKLLLLLILIPLLTGCQQNFGAKTETLKDKYDKATEIKKEYKMEKASFIREAKDENDIQIEVGDKTKDTFTEELNISKWENEVSLKIKHKNNENKVLELDGNKIKMKGNKTETHFYEVEDAYEYEIILLEKPNTNIVEFDISTKGLEFFYQPELTQKEKDEGAFRPDNVVGSYAVYCSEQKTNWTGGKLYKTGKFGHIYRPKIIDSAGTEVWGILNIDKGILSVEIPQSFLDTCQYPVRHASGLTFGYGTIGGSNAKVSAYAGTQETPRGSHYTGAAGTVDSITAYTGASGGNSISISGGIYSDTSLVAQTEIVALPNSTSWKTWNFASPPNITAIDYILVVQQGSTAYETQFYYDTGSANQGEYGTKTEGNTLPSTISWTDDGTKKFSIYATYTAGGASDTCTCTPGSDWFISANDNCFLSTSCDLGKEYSIHILNDKGPGSFNIIDNAVLSVHSINNTSTPVNVEAGSKINFK